MKMYLKKTVAVATILAILIPVHAFAQEKKREFVGNAQCKLCHNKPVAIAPGVRNTIFIPRVVGLR